MEEIDEEELKEYLSKLECRGCYNRCNLSSPNCGRSRIFIKEATEKYKKENKRMEN